MVVFPHGDVPHAAVIPIGEPPSAACAAVAETLRETFEMPVPVEQPLERPDGNDPDTGNVRAYLRQLEDETDGIDLAIGVTDGRLTQTAGDTPQWGLFGVGYEFGTVGIVSTARLVEGATLSELERKRLATETLSVVGTMLGLRSRVHGDDDSPCAVAPGESRRELDAAPASYCTACWNALTDGTTAPKPDDWIVREPDESDTSVVGDEHDERKWWHYLLIPVGFVVLAAIKGIALLEPVVKRLPRPGTGSRRDIPQPIHTGYRIVTFWTNVVLYLGAIVGWSVVIVSIHDRFLGAGFSDAGLVGLLVGSVVLGVYTAWIIKAIVGGLYDAVRVVAAEEWS